ncbi:MAG: FAD-dependent oxidoreductase [Sneathiella sp.]|nr:FAD-dependent oxidoreductase [Sneathiella sp.]
MDSSKIQSIVVVGAGIVGVSTAIWLQRAGHKVTLMDREGPAAGASYGNAGVIASGSLIPITAPGLLRKAPGMLFSPNKPLFLRWRYLPKLLPFLKDYLKHANTKSVERISEGLSTLLHDAPDQHLALASGTPAENYIETMDYLFGYEDKAAFDADQFSWDVRKRRGVEFDPLDAKALADYDPALKGRFNFGVRCKNHGRISDPGAYVTALADHFTATGGVFLQGELQGFDIQNDRCVQIQTPDGPVTADKFVITTGAWSSAWAKELGISVPMESERGYHIEFVNPSITLRSPLMVAGGKFVLNSMNGRLRCAGVIEFGGLTPERSKAPIALLKNQMAELFPDLRYDRIDEWMGHRPATADSLPIIGVSPKVENIYLGYGHHHIGLTGGPKTGRWLANLITGTPINTDLTAYAADRKV